MFWALRIMLPFMHNLEPALLHLRTYFSPLDVHLDDSATLGKVSFHVNL
jgi:hypothetical protein